MSETHLDEHNEEHNNQSTNAASSEGSSEPHIPSSPLVICLSLNGNSLGKKLSDYRPLKYDATLPLNIQMGSYNPIRLLVEQVNTKEQYQDPHDTTFGNVNEHLVSTYKNWADYLNIWCKEHSKNTSWWGFVCMGSSLNPALPKSHTISDRLMNLFVNTNVSPKLEWTDAVFDFVLYNIVYDEEYSRWMTSEIYLIDLYVGPYNNICSDADVMFSLPDVKRFLQQTCFKTKGPHMFLKKQYKFYPLVSIFKSGPSIGVPLNESVIKILQRDYYFNGTFPFELNNEPGIVNNVKVVYAPISARCATPIPHRIQNLVTKGFADDHCQEGHHGPSWTSSLDSMVNAFKNEQ